MNEEKNYPKLIATSKEYRLVQRTKDAFVVEYMNPNAYSSITWIPICDISDDGDRVIWVMTDEKCAKSIVFDLPAILFRLFLSEEAKSDQ